MKIPGAILAILVLVFLGGCGSFGGTFGDHVVVGRCFVGGDLVTNGHGAEVRVGGKSFQVTQDAVTWDERGSVKLPAEWNEVELAEWFGGVAIEVDGRKLADVKQ